MESEGFMSTQVVPTQPEMREKPILFSTPMVRGILQGRKTQTRRTVKGIPLDWLSPDKFTPEFVADKENDLCPFGNIGDQMWVRETFATGPKDHAWGSIIYRATHGAMMVPTCEGFTPWKPSIHMPKSLSRITLAITDVRVERLRDISDDDAIAEGAIFKDFGTGSYGNPLDGWTMEPEMHDKGWEYCLSAPRWAFANFIEKINPGTWYADKWCWVISFKQVNI
jgi:hypothetical protein